MRKKKRPSDAKPTSTVTVTTDAVPRHPLALKIAIGVYIAWAIVLAFFAFTS